MRALSPPAPITGGRAPADIFREIVFVLILLAVWMSTRPYDPPDPLADGGSTSDIVNQLTFSGLAVASLIGLQLGHARVLRPMLQPSYGLLILWLFVSVGFALDAGASLRALAFTLIAMLLAASLFALPRDGQRFQTLLFGAAAAVLALSWFGIVALPEIAIHSDVDPVEPEHAGSWRGHFTHKNVAGAMMVVIAIIGIHALRSGRRGIGLALLVGAVVFLYFSRAKTSLGLFPVAVALVFLVERIPSLLVRAGLTLGPILALNVLTLGSALNRDIAALNRDMLSDPSFTGRFDIWRYGFEKFSERPWTGFGFESFWLTDHTLRGESKLDLAWSPERIVHGHNSYLDVLLTLGLPGLALVTAVFLIKPLWDYHHCKPGAANRHLASACLMIWLFVSLCMCLEVFYFRRADPVWFALLFAVIGLRMTASHRIVEPRKAD